MLELPAKKKLQQFKRFLKFKKITSNTFAVDKAQLQIMIDFFCSDKILGELINYNETSTEEILKNQISNYVLTLKNMSINIQYKFDELYCNCLDIEFDIKPLQSDINYMKDKIIDEMMYNDFYNDPELILGALNGILSTLEWIDMIVNLLKINYDKIYKFDHCEHLFEKTQYLFVSTIGQIPICNMCNDDLLKIFDKHPCPWVYLNFNSLIRISPVNEFYQLEL